MNSPLSNLAILLVALLSSGSSSQKNSAFVIVGELPTEGDSEQVETSFTQSFRTCTGTFLHLQVLLNSLCAEPTFGILQEEVMVGCAAC